MPIELIEDGPADPTETREEYILVSDTTSEVIRACESLAEAQSLARLIRRACGHVTVFKATKY